MVALTDDKQSKIEKELVRINALTAEQLEEYRKTAQEAKRPIFEYLQAEKKVADEDMSRAMAAVSGTPYVNLLNVQIDPKVLALLPREVAERFMAVPLGKVQHRLAIAMLDPSNVQATDFISNKISLPLKIYTASEAGIRAVITQYHTDLEGGVSDALDVAAAEEEAETAEKKFVISQDSPISRALNTILEYAAQSRASDIHIEPYETVLKVRCRNDGVLREIMKLPKGIEPALVSRIKI